MRNFKYIVLIGALTVVIAIMFSACAPNKANDKVSEIRSTKVDANADDDQQSFSSGLMIRLGIDDLVQKSDAIVIAKVAEILPSKEFYDKERNRLIIITDVILDLKRSLYGKMQSDRFALKVLGGRIGKTVLIVSDAPVFNLGEESVLFLQRLPQNDLPPIGIEAADYYIVYGSEQGKFGFNEDSMIGYQGNHIAISEIEQKIALIRGGNSTISQ